MNNSEEVTSAEGGRVYLDPPSKPDLSSELDDFIEIVPELGAPKLYLTQREYDFLKAWRDKAVRDGRIDELKSTQTRLMSIGIGENKLSSLLEERISELQEGKE